MRCVEVDREPDAGEVGRLGGEPSWLNGLDVASPVDVALRRSAKSRRKLAIRSSLLTLGVLGVVGLAVPVELEAVVPSEKNRERDAEVESLVPGADWRLAKSLLRSAIRPAVSELDRLRGGI